MDIAQDGNLFPREDILEAVAQSDWRDQPVPAAAWALTAMGLALLAFGTPTLAPLAMEPATFASAGNRLWAHPLHGVARILAQAGLGIESAWYLISALFLGLSLPALGGALRVVGIGARLSLVVSLVSLLTPIALGHGQLPSDFTAGIFGASIVLGLCCAPSDPGASGARGYGVRLGASLLVATALHPLNVALVPALLLAAKARAGLAAVVPVLVCSVAAVFFAVDATITSAGPILPTLFGACLLGYGGLIVLSFLAWSTEKEESPPPLWLTVQWISGIVLSVAMVFLDAPMLPMLVVASAALASSVLARFARPDNAFRALGLALVAQLLLLGAAGLLRPSLATAGLAHAQPTLFRPGDIFFTDRANERSPAVYLIRGRFGHSVFLVDEPLTGPWKGTEEEGARAIGFGDSFVEGWGKTLPWTLDPAKGTIDPHE